MHASGRGNKQESVINTKLISEVLERTFNLFTHHWREAPSSCPPTPAVSRNSYFRRMCVLSFTISLSWPVHSVVSCEVVQTVLSAEWRPNWEQRDIFLLYAGPVFDAQSVKNTE